MQLQIPTESILGRLLKYSYGGFIVSIIAVLVDPEAVKRVATILGTVLSPLVTIGMGVCIYVLHREVFGELVLYRLLSFAHDCWDWVRGRKGNRVTNTLAYLGILGVRSGNRRAAYNAVRNSFFKPDMRGRFDILHTELHLLWITVDVLIIASFYQALAMHSLYLLLPVLTFFLAVLAAVADIRQHQLECHQLKIEEKRDGGVTNFLKDNLYIENAATTSVGTVTQDRTDA